MRKLLTNFVTLFLCLGILTSLGFAQGAPLANAKNKMRMKAMMNAKGKIYACEKCDMASTHGGKCPGCGQKMNAIEASYIYACEDCHKESKNPGK